MLQKLSLFLTVYFPNSCVKIVYFITINALNHMIHAFIKRLVSVILPLINMFTYKVNTDFGMGFKCQGHSIKGVNCHLVMTNITCFRCIYSSVSYGCIGVSLINKVK